MLRKKDKRAKTGKLPIFKHSNAMSDFSEHWIDKYFARFFFQSFKGHAVSLTMDELGNVLLQELRFNLTASFYHCCTLIFGLKDTGNEGRKPGGLHAPPPKKSDALSEIGENPILKDSSA